MHPMRLTNKQIQEILSNIRKDLKISKTISTSMAYTLQMPKYENKEKAKLIIKQEAYAKLTALVDQCSKEIAWHGIVEKQDNVYTITDILVFPQTVTGTTVTSDETEYSMWIANQPDAVFNKIRFHGHSHVNMGTSPSGIDTQYQENILRNLKDFYIFAIFNKKGDSWCAIYDVESNIAYDNKDIELVTPDTAATAWAKEEIKKYINEPEKKPAAKKKTTTVVEAEEDYSTDGYGYNYSGSVDWWRGYYGQK